jgi:hypothetical protein
MELVLHIGTEKTATKTIQHFLYQNRTQLLSQGIALSNTLGIPNNAILPMLITRGVGFEWYLEKLKLNDPEALVHFFEQTRNAFLKEVEQLSRTAHTLVISSEHLHSRLFQIEQISNLKEFLSPLFSNISVICYFREQTELIKSSYSTLIKSGGTTSFSNWLNSCSIENYFCNHHLSFTKWKNVFGKTNLKPRLFLKNEFYETDIRKDILRQISPTLDFTNFEFSANNYNLSLGLLGLAMGKVVNSVCALNLKNGLPSESREIILNKIENLEIQSVGSLCVPNIKELYQKFAPSNIKFAEEFLGLNDNPFPEPLAESSNSLSYFEQDSLEKAMNSDCFNQLFKELVKSVLLNDF